MNKYYRVGIIGAGAIAKSHLNALSGMENIKLVSVADIILERAEETAFEYTLNAYTDYKLMLEKEKLDIVIINLPHFLHKSVSIDCANSGCHILLEKPMAMDEQECNEIIDVCKAENRKLMIGHVRRFYPAAAKIKEIIDSGQYGRLLMITNIRYANYFNPGRPKWFFKYNTAGGGIIMNLGAHSFDLVHYFTGSEIKSLRAKTGKHAEGIEVEGNAQIFVETDNEVTATISINGYNSVTRDETELIFENGMVRMNSNYSISRINNEGGYTEETLEGLNPFFLQFSELINCIDEDREPAISGEYGRRIIKAVKAVYNSSDSGKEIILNNERLTANEIR